MTTLTQPEPWLRGPVDGFEPLLMPVVHALIQVREDIENLVARVPAEHTWERPGGAASIGFHVRHLGGALDRLFTYARGEALSDTQKVAMRAEGDLVDPAPSLADVAADMNASIERALEQLRTTTRDDLLTARTVGRAGLPTTTLGLLFHAAEHNRSPSPPRSWAKTTGSPQVHVSDARDRRDGLRQARVCQPWNTGPHHRGPRLVSDEVGPTLAVPLHGRRGNGQHAHGDSVQAAFAALVGHATRSRACASRV